MRLGRAHYLLTMHQWSGVLGATSNAARASLIACIVRPQGSISPGSTCIKGPSLSPLKPLRNITDLHVLHTSLLCCPPRIELPTSPHLHNGLQQPALRATAAPAHQGRAP